MVSEKREMKPRGPFGAAAVVLALAGFATANSQISNPAANLPAPCAVPVVEQCDGGEAAPTIAYTMEFDGINDLCVAQTGMEFDPGGAREEIAVSFWIYKENDENQGYIAACGQYIGSPTWDSDMLFRMYGERFEVMIQEGLKYVRVAVAELPTSGRWVHWTAALHLNGTTSPDGTVWYDGVEVGATVSLEGGVDTTANLDTLYVPGVDTCLVTLGGMLKTVDPLVVESQMSQPCSLAGFRVLSSVPTTAQVRALMEATDPTGWGTEAHWRFDPGHGQTVIDTVADVDLWLGTTSGSQTSDPTWGGGYTSLGASGPVVAWIKEHMPHWSWEWLAWLFPESAWATPVETERRIWVVNEALVDSVAAHWPLARMELGGGGRRLYGTAGDTVRCYAARLTAAEWQAVQDSGGTWIRDTDLDSTSVMPMDEEW